MRPNVCYVVKKSQLISVRALKGQIKVSTKLLFTFLNHEFFMKRPTQSYIYLGLFSLLLLNGNCNTQNTKQDKLQNTFNKMESDKTDLPGKETTQSNNLSANCPQKITV